MQILMGVSGGLGLFLIGMILMTEGLRAVAGDAMRAGLMRFTRTPYSGALTGAVSTAILQSSSATTVAAVGFVGAELMSFTNALGIIFGANLGTTMTGWLVALLGFKLDLGQIALPLVMLGALARLFARGRMASGGLALAGFALIFVGIDTLQAGMRGLEGLVDFTALPADSPAARLSLVAIGIGFTLITQSSSAAVAATLTVLNAGFIDFPQAACLVIGADVGTTVTAALATIGASLDARRTGLSHVIYNLLTGTLAFVLIGPFMALAGLLAPGLETRDPELLLVGFHSGFNLLGTLLVLPAALPFAHLVERLVPPLNSDAHSAMDKGLLGDPRAALDAAQREVLQGYAVLTAEAARQLELRDPPAAADLPQWQRYLDELQDYLSSIDLHGTRGGEWDRLLALVHACDHLQRLHERLEEEQGRARTVATAAALDLERLAFLAAERSIAARLEAGQHAAAHDEADALAGQIQASVAPFRESVTADMASHALSFEAGTERLEAIRWLERVTHHLARITLHLERAADASGR